MAFYKGQKYSNKPKKYTYFSDGTGYSFNPAKTVNFNGKLITLLDFHKQEAKFRQSENVFILNDTGEKISLS